MFDTNLIYKKISRKGLATLLEGAGWRFFTVNLKVKILSFLWCFKAVKLESDINVVYISVQSINGVNKATGLLLVKCYDNKMAKSPYNCFIFPLNQPQVANQQQQKKKEVCCVKQIFVAFRFCNLNSETPFLTSYKWPAARIICCKKGLKRLSD